MRVLIRQIPLPIRPEAVFHHGMRNEPYAFWLDGNLPVEGLSRWSFLGMRPRFLIKASRGMTRIIGHGRTETVGGNPFEAFRSVWDRFRLASTEHGEFPFIGGFVGYFGYEMNRYVEKVPADLPNPVGNPESYWMFFDRVVIWDQIRQKAYLARILTEDERMDRVREEMDRETEQILLWSELPLPEPPEAADIASGEGESRFTQSETKESYLEKIRKIQEFIGRGEIYQACFTHQTVAGISAHPFDLYRILRRINPSPFSSYLRMGNLAVCSSSPERFLKKDPSGILETRPIKGTRRRSPDPREDQAGIEDLLNSVKDRAENVMIVDLARHDLGRVSETGSVRVPELFRVESYATVHQLVSIVEGRLRSGLSPVDAIKAAFPGGSMTGAPKIRAMEILHGLETVARGIYSGGLGYLDVRGSFDLSMVIRTVICREGRAWFHVGGGIVADSDPEAEYRESLDKAVALKKAILLTEKAFAGSGQK